MNKHFVNNWWKYIFIGIIALLGYYYLAPVVQTTLQTETTDSAETTDPVVAAETAVEDAPATESTDSTADVSPDNTDTTDIMSEYTKTDSGLGYKVITQGTGTVKPTASSTVEVHYHGTLTDGSVFDSSRERGQTISFGLNQVIAGWTEGLQLMSVGDVYELYIPANLGYGEFSPSPAIPAGSDLIFEIELFDIK